MEKQKKQPEQYQQEQSPVQQEAAAPKQLRQTPIKWLFIVLVGFFTFGVYYTINIQSVLRDELGTTFGISGSTYNWVYSYPMFFNIPLGLLNGMLIDFIGYRNGAAIFCVLQLIATVLMYVGSKDRSFSTYLFGVLFNTICAETIALTQNAITSKWFIGDALSLAVSISLMFLRVFQITSSLTAAPLYNKDDELSTTYLVGLGTALFSVFVAVLGAYILDYKQDKSAAAAAAHAQLVPVKLKRINFRDLRHLPLMYWLINLTAVIGYSSYYPFMQVAESVLKRRFDLTNDQAGQIMSLPFFFAMVSPVMGTAVDRFGKRPQLLIGCFLFGTLTFVLWALLPSCEDSPCPVPPSFPVSMQGLFLGLFPSIIYGSIPLVVQKQYVATAYGLISSIKAIFLAVTPIIVQKIYSDLRMIWLFVFFFFVSLFGLVLSLAIYFMDKAQGRRLSELTKSNTFRQPSFNLGEDAMVVEGEDNANGDPLLLGHDTDARDFRKDINETSIYTGDEGDSRVLTHEEAHGRAKDSTSSQER